MRGVGPVADVFIALTILAGALMLLLVVYQNVLLFTHTEIVSERPPRLSETLAIPGVNPVIPVGYGLFALLVALVIHEGGHGVLARHAEMKVKSLGLLFLVIPVGAFVEPDEAHLQDSSLRQKLRLFSAGPGPNIVLAMICVLAFAQVFTPAMAPQHEGVAMLNVIEGLPAEQAGLEAGMFITGIDGKDVRSYADFQNILLERQAEEGEDPAMLPVQYWQRGETGTATIVPLDKYAYYKDRGFTDEQLESACTNQQGQDTCRGVPFLGVTPAGPNELSNLTANFQHPFEQQGLARGSLFYVAMPFANLQPFPDTFHDIFTPTGTFEGWGDAFWITANTLYWLFWINIVLGTFNALPFWVLDGGHMFRQSLHWFLRRRKGIKTEDLTVLDAEDGAPHYIGKDPATQERLDEVDETAGVISRTLTVTMLILILAPLLVPQFL
ncbi:MAG: site-2 protease family protein, partial [Candidatus Thermoplasmatota archaeon]|nr:site-2 protease family protein [Candidatus Thermoplasmatota archaeon]